MKLYQLNSKGDYSGVFSKDDKIQNIRLKKNLLLEYFTWKQYSQNDCIKCRFAEILRE